MYLSIKKVLYSVNFFIRDMLSFPNTLHAKVKIAPYRELVRKFLTQCKPKPACPRKGEVIGEGNLRASQLGGGSPLLTLQKL